MDHGTKHPGDAPEISLVSHAVVVGTRAGGEAVVGGLPLAARAVLTLREAGFEVSLAGVAHLGQTRAWLDRRRVRVGRPPALAGRAPVLVITGDVMFELPVLAPLLAAAEPGRVRAAQGPASVPGDIRAAICPQDALPALTAALSNGRCSLSEALQRVGHLSEPVPLGHGLFLALDAAHPPAALTAALLEHLGRRAAATDGYLATWLDRPLSRRLTRSLLPWPITPNHITVVSIAIGLVGALGLASVSYLGRLGGVLALLLSSVLDGVDGEIARARFEQSAVGARLDLIGDYVVHVATFAGLGIGLARHDQSLPLIVAGSVLFAGVVAAIGVMHRLVNGPALTRSDDLHDPAALTGLRGTQMIARIEKLAGRDYVYLLFVFALVGRLDWFVSAAAVGSWVFVAGLIAYGARCEAPGCHHGGPA